MPGLRIALVQSNPVLGDLAGNRERIADALAVARAAGARLVVLPELALSGYPPEDLLASQSFLRDARTQLERLLPASEGLLALVGLPLRTETGTANAAAVLLDGAWVDTYEKAALPNYGVFDEKRYFRSGRRCPVYRFGELRFGVNICEDLWIPTGVPAAQGRAGARLLCNLSASPYHAGKGAERRELFAHRAREHRTAIAYANLVGGQDELVFDGDSLVISADGQVRARGAQFREQVLIVDLEPEWLVPGAAAADDSPYLIPDCGGIDVPDANLWTDSLELSPPAPPATGAPASPGTPTSTDAPPSSGSTWRSATPPFFASRSPATSSFPAAAGLESVPPLEPKEAEVYAALVLGTHDYVVKNGFRSVVLGLSGGIDSALTATVASDALGPESVLGVSLPSRFNSQVTRNAAAELAERLGIGFRTLPIEDIFASFLQTLDPVFGKREPDVTEENLQSRIRGTLLMALSNKEGHMLLTTGNKSELAVGYCTLYGDMAGGFAVLKDVPKTLIYGLARYRNTLSDVIPRATLEAAPSAELREDQRDTDSLPPYEILDPIIEARVEHELGRESLIARGFDAAVVDRIFRLIDQSEYKRRQAPPGIKITPRAFGKDRRYPITNAYRDH